MRYSENGLASTGDSVLDSELLITGSVFWVDSVNGNDSNSGFYEKPYATLAAAISAATANNGDIIVIKSGHSETLTSAITVSKAGLKIYGLGSGSNAPNFLVNAAIDGFDVTGANVELNNFYFPAGTTAGNNSRINVGASGVVIKDCEFLCGLYDQNTITIPAAGVNAKVDSCTFTVSADGPDAGILVESASVIGLNVNACTFDGGTYNWDDAGIYSNVAHTEFYYSGIILSNAARIRHAQANAKGHVFNPTVDETSEIILA
jgi:hypothetical protein